MLIMYPTALTLKIVLASMELSISILFVAVQKSAGTVRIQWWYSHYIFIEIKETFVTDHANKHIRMQEYIHWF